MEDNNKLILKEDYDITYHSIRDKVVVAQKSVATAVNTAMVLAYWEIGREIYIACGENERAA